MFTIHHRHFTMRLSVSFFVIPCSFLASGSRTPSYVDTCISSELLLWTFRHARIAPGACSLYARLVLMP